MKHKTQITVSLGDKLRTVPDISLLTTKMQMGKGFYIFVFIHLNKNITNCLEIFW